jgi:hypothetical protein
VPADQDKQAAALGAAPGARRSRLDEFKLIDDAAATAAEAVTKMAPRMAGINRATAGTPARGQEDPRPSGSEGRRRPHRAADPAAAAGNALG